MKISELIIKLESLKQEHGDIRVMVNEDGFGGHALHTLSSKIRTSSFGSYMIEDMGEDEFRELFPDWDGETEFEDTDMEISYVELSTGSMIYST